LGVPSPRLDPAKGAAQNGPTVKAVARGCVAVVSVLSFVVLVETLFGHG
jgi:hypothetical protein